MKFPSLSTLAGGAWNTFLRFPVTILLAIIATVIMMRLTYREPSEIWLYRDRNMVISCYLGMLLSIALTVAAEKWGKGRWLAAGLQAATAIGVWLLYLSLPNHFFLTRTDLQLVLFGLGLHWLIAVIGFRAGEVNGFWVYNKKLFLRILTSALYTGVLYLGLTLALLAIDQLFNVNVRTWVYEDLWLFLAGIFNTWFFLAGFPAEYENPDPIGDYPKGLRIFTQYVLLTLVTIYLVILYAYLIKIVVTAHWPAGWVAWLVMGFSVAGILSLLLIYPLRGDSSNKWISGYSKFFYIALLPLIVLLFCAIWKRIAPYGMTEQRYFLVVLAFWLLFVAIYFLASRKKDIRLVPMSLCLLAFLSSFGPWGAFSVSLRSQEGRLRSLLEKNGRMVNGKVVNGNNATVSLADRKEISSVTLYIVGMHGYKVLQPWFDRDLDAVVGTNTAFGSWQDRERATALVGLMNIGYSDEYKTEDAAVPTRYFSINASSSDEALLTEGAMYIIPDINVDAATQNDPSCSFYKWDKVTWQFCLDGVHHQLRISSGMGVGAVVDLGPIVSKLQMYTNDLSQDQMILEIDGPLMHGKLVLSGVRGQTTGSTVFLSHVKGAILFSRK